MRHSGDRPWVWTPKVPGQYSLRHRIRNLLQAIPRVVSVPDGAFITGTRLCSVTDKGKPVQCVVLKCRHFVATICELSQVALAVILRAFDRQERILACGKPIHVVIRVGRRIVARIGECKQVPVLIVRHRRDAALRVGDLRHKIERVVFPRGFVAERIDRGNDSTGSIKELLDGPHQWIRHGR